MGKNKLIARDIGLVDKLSNKQLDDNIEIWEKFLDHYTYDIPEVVCDDIKVLLRQMKIEKILR
jgi:hypothetical protein